MRKKLLIKNTVSSLSYQIVAIICGFILPRLILEHYGSDINGLTHSITQFLQVIAFLELGVGAVVQSSLYKPLAEKNNAEISKIFVSANHFFRKLAFILTVYVVILVLVYPQIVIQDFDFLFTATLILTMSINSFAQYYFGIVNSLLLLADQHGYIQYTTQIILSILNTFLCAILIRLNVSIQLVKLMTSIILLIRPIILQIYVRRHYKIDRKIKFKGEPIKQKWNGIAQHISTIVLDGTDYIVLTLFATLKDVSIYAVYNLVIYGVKQLFISATNGFQSLLGDLWAKEDREGLRKIFGLIEWIIHSSVTFVFACTGFLIVPFITVYTKGVDDAVYYQPLFAAILTLATASYCLRLPYNIMIKAAGHYKETQNSYILAAAMNIIISIITVKIWGLIGVAIGTFISMLFQTLWMCWYDSKRILCWPIWNSVKQVLVDITILAVSFLSTCWIQLQQINYIAWLMQACIVALITFSVCLIVNMLFYRDNIKYIIKRIRIR